MLDIKFIKDNKEKIADAIAKKNIDFDLGKLLEVDLKRLELLQAVEDLSSQKNALNNAISQAQSDTAREEAITNGKEIKERMEAIEPEYKKIKDEFDELMVKVPNIISADTPSGKLKEKGKFQNLILKLKIMLSLEKIWIFWI